MEVMARDGKANGITCYLPIVLPLVSTEGWDVNFRPGPWVAKIKYENNLENEWDQSLDKIIFGPLLAGPKDLNLF